LSQVRNRTATSGGKEAEGEGDRDSDVDGDGDERQMLIVSARQGPMATDVVVGNVEQCIQCRITPVSSRRRRYLDELPLSLLCT
jgi:hypothetical protein